MIYGSRCTRVSRLVEACDSTVVFVRGTTAVGYGGVVDRSSDSQSKEPGLESSCCRFDVWAILGKQFTQRHEWLYTNCVNGYIPTV